MKKQKQAKVEVLVEYEVGQEIEVQGKRVKIVEILGDVLHVKNLAPNFESFLVNKTEV